METVFSFFVSSLMVVGLTVLGPSAFASFGDLTCCLRVNPSGPNSFEIDLKELTAIQVNPNIQPTEKYSTTKSNIKNLVLQPNSWEVTLTKTEGIKGSYLQPKLRYEFNPVSARWVTAPLGYTFQIFREGFYIGFARGNLVYSFTQSGINKALSEGAEINIQTTDFHLVVSKSVASGFKLKMVDRNTPLDP